MTDEKHCEEAVKPWISPHANMNFVLSVAFCQIATFVFFACGTKYHDASGAGEETVGKFYPMFQDVHVMIFIGFGFLMTFLRKHMFSSLGLTFLIGTLAIQLGIMWNHLWHAALANHWEDLTLEVPTLITGDFAAGAVLISYGAVLGRVTPTQLVWMTFFELIFYAINEYIGVNEFKAVDMGGSMYVHTFGAYFGLAFSWALGPPKEEETEEETSSYNSDMFAMVGTIFLWMYWPSFNGALAGAYPELFQQERVVINTVLALSSSCMSTFLFSNLFQGEFDMVLIQNASLAGGVAVGSSSDLVIGPFASIIIGFVAGFISCFGYCFFTPFLNRHGIYDVCGVNNLHGMPGLLGGIGGAISAAVADDTEYGSNIEIIFSARSCGDGQPCRSAEEQGWAQAGALLTSFCIASVSGILVGFMLKRIDNKMNKFQDKDDWEIPEEEHKKIELNPLLDSGNSV